MPAPEVPCEFESETAREAYAADLVVDADRNGDRDGALNFAEYYELVCGTLAQYDACVASRRGATTEAKSAYKDYHELTTKTTSSSAYAFWVTSKRFVSERLPPCTPSKKDKNEGKPGAVDHSIKEDKEARPTPTPNPGDNTRFKLETADESAGGGGLVHDGWLPLWAQVALLVVVVALLGAVCGCAGYWLRGRQGKTSEYDDDRDESPPPSQRV